MAQNWSLVKPLTASEATQQRRHGIPLHTAAFDLHDNFAPHRPDN